jgi:hypothetical protein
LFETDLDERLDQAEVLREIIENPLPDVGVFDAFNAMKMRPVKLSTLQRFYEDDNNMVLNILSRRHTIAIDEDFRVRAGTGRMKLFTEKCTIDYHLTVANSIGMGSLLPNAANSPWFCLQLNLKMPYRNFKGKHAMVGFDTKGRMLYIGQCRNEDVFLAMAPNEFCSGNYEPCAAGFSSGLSTMSKRHYRQMVMMIAHFMAKIPGRGYCNRVEVYKQDLEASSPDWGKVTNTM